MIVAELERKGVGKVGLISVNNVYGQEHYGLQPAGLGILTVKQGRWVLAA